MEYGYRGGELLIEGGCDAVRWRVTDHLGSTRMSVAATGTLASVKRTDYLPFGEELGAGIRSATYGYGADCWRQKFTGQERDVETGLDFFGARYFGSSQGRFTSPDPLLNSGRPNLPQSWNRYAYVLNNPLKFIDPDGLYEWGASLGGSASDDKVSEDVRKRREIFRATIANNIKNLETLKKAHGETSDEYKKAAKAVNAYGTEHDGNKVNVGVVADNKQSMSGNTTSMDSKGNVYVTFKQSYFDRGLAAPGGQPDTSLLEGLVAHEGWHVDETKNGTKLGTWDSEYSGLSVQASMGMANTPDGSRYWIMGKKEVVFWNSEWGKVDRVTKKDEAIKQLLQAPTSEGGYGMSPPKKKP